MNIYINDGSEIPNDETCYIIAKSGIFLKKKLDLVESLTPVDKISFLNDIPSFAKLNIPKIPLRMFGNILGFFKEVYKLYRSEAVVLVFYNKEKKIFKVHVPEQEVSFSSVSYDSTKTIKDFQLIGSIHSHSSMSAFHSGTDVNDENKFDGIHITVGKVDGDVFFDVCASVAVNGMRVPVQPEEYINGLECREYTNYFPHMFRPAFDVVDGEKVYNNTVKTSIGYVLNEHQVDSFVMLKWIPKVKEKKYEYFNGGDLNYGRTVKYTFKDGKLIKLNGIENNDLKQIPFEPLKRTQNPCETCIYKHKKIKLYVEEDEKNLINNKVEDFYEGFSNYGSFESW